MVYITVFVTTNVFACQRKVVFSFFVIYIQQNAFNGLAENVVILLGIGLIW